MAGKGTEPEPKRVGLRLGRIFFAVLFLGLLAAGGYGASWLNARRFFLIVEGSEARVAKGRMLPWGHEPFFPDDPMLRRAYGVISLPGGFRAPRGETQFEDRNELDQSLFRLLLDALEYALDHANERTQVLAADYIAQLEAIPGTSAGQAKQIEELARRAHRVEAQLLLTRARGQLDEAAKLFRAAGIGTAGGEDEAKAIESVLQLLSKLERASGITPTPDMRKPALAVTSSTASTAPNR